MLDIAWAGGVQQTLAAALRAQAEAHCRLICPRCRDGAPHHSNAASSIGGEEGRRTIWELHVSTGGGLEECLAAPIWEAMVGT